MFVIWGELLKENSQIQRDEYRGRKVTNKIYHELSPDPSGRIPYPARAELKNKLYTYEMSMIIQSQYEMNINFM